MESQVWGGDGVHQDEQEKSIEASDWGAWYAELGEAAEEVDEKLA